MAKKAETETKKKKRRQRRKGTQVRGDIRRKEILSAARSLLSKKEPEDITYNEIARVAGIPASSAFHFFPNISSIFSVIAAEFGEQYVAAMAAPMDDEQITSWQDIIDIQIERGANLYRRKPAAMKILISGKTPPLIKLAERKKRRAEKKEEQRIGQVIEQTIRKYFVMPEITNLDTVFFIYVEIVDFILMLSVMEYSKITDAMIREAQRAGKSYLRNYIPEIMPYREQ